MGTGAHVPSTSNNFIVSSLCSKSASRLSKYWVVCEISWCRCQQLTALLISTALVTQLLVIEQLLHPALKCPVTFQSLPLLTSNPGDATVLRLFLCIVPTRPNLGLTPNPNPDHKPGYTDNTYGLSHLQKRQNVVSCTDQALPSRRCCWSHFRRRHYPDRRYRNSSFEYCRV